MDVAFEVSFTENLRPIAGWSGFRLSGRAKFPGSPQGANEPH